MKTKSFLASLAAAVLVLAGCEEKITGTGELSVDKDLVEFAGEGGTQTVILTAGADWKIKGYTDEVKAWLNISPDSGSATNKEETITIKALENTGAKRSVSLEFFADIMHKAPITITQGAGGNAGEGTKEKPYSASEANEFAATLAADVASDYVYIKGIVSSITEISTSYGNGTYYISNDGTSNDPFYVFRGYGFGGEKFKSETDIKVGDELIIYAQVVNYKGNTPETVQGKSQIYSCNGTVYDGGNTSGSGSTEYGEAKGSGTQEDPYNVAAIVKYTSALAADVVSTDDVYFKGKICKMVEYNYTDYGNATYYISEDGTDGANFYVYRSYSINNEKFTTADEIKVGDEVVVVGKVVNYKGNTPETAQGKAYLYSINGKTTIDKGSYLNISNETLTVASSTTSITFKIYSNTTWTVESSNAAVTVAPASGENDGEVTLSFAENTASTDVTATITVKSSVGDKTIAFTQKGFVESSGNEVTFDASADKAIDTDTAAAYTLTKDGVTLTLSNGILGGKSNQYRIYKGQNLVVSCDSNIEKIEFECTASGDTKYGPGCFAAQDGYTFSDKTGTWVGSAKEVTFTASTNQVRATIIKVTIAK